MSRKSEKPFGSEGPTMGETVEEFARKYEQAQKKLGRFNLALVGTTGTGKSTLVNAIFGGEVAKTGTGRPVTSGVDYYEHPSGIFGMYDSEGIEIGESKADVVGKLTSIIAEKRGGPLRDQVHVCWYCVRAGDERFEDAQAHFVEALAKLVPVMLVMTQVPNTQKGVHPKAQQFAKDIEERRLPLAPGNRVFLTMAEPDNHLDQVQHGLHELLDATFDVAPDGVRTAIAATQKLDVDIKAREARKPIAPAAAAAAAAGATPIPFSDAAILVPIQVGLMASISATFGLQIRTGVLATMAGAALTAGGVTNAGKYLVTNLLKFVPGGNVVGGTIRATVASALTYAVGEAWIGVCRQLYRMDPEAASSLPAEEIKKMFTTELKKRAKRR